MHCAPQIRVTVTYSPHRKSSLYQLSKWKYANREHPAFQRGKVLWQETLLWVNSTFMFLYKPNIHSLNSSTHNRNSKEPSLWGCEAYCGSEHDTECFNPQTIVTDPLLDWISSWRYILWYIHCHLFPGDSDTMSYPSASNEIYRNDFYNRVSQDLNLPLSTVPSIAAQWQSHTENTHCKSWPQTTVWI